MLINNKLRIQILNKKGLNTETLLSTQEQHAYPKYGFSALLLDV
jgi:hypothetical protein